MSRRPRPEALLSTVHLTQRTGPSKQLSAVPRDFAHQLGGVSAQRLGARRLIRNGLQTAMSVELGLLPKTGRPELGGRALRSVTFRRQHLRAATARRRPPRALVLFPRPHGKRQRRHSQGAPSSAKGTHRGPEPRTSQGSHRRHEEPAVTARPLATAGSSISAHVSLRGCNRPAFRAFRTN